MPLHLDYRPERLEDVVGNWKTINALRSVITRKNDVPRAILFHGPSGCGKTTLARIMGRMLNVDESSLAELNVADFRGIDTIREIISQMRFPPLNGKYRMWILDEAHQLSKDAQTALLKALEDSPKHCIIVLATTEPEKLLTTIRTRCHAFEVFPLDEEQLVELMSSVLKKAKVKVPADVLDQIAVDAMGSARMALVILDKIMDLEQSEMKKAAAQEAVRVRKTLELCRLLLEGTTWKTIASCLKGLNDENPEQVRQAVLTYMASVLLSGNNPKAFTALVAFKDPFYTAGRAALVRACYETCFGTVE